MKDNPNLQLAKLEETEFIDNLKDENGKDYLFTIGRPIDTVIDNLRDKYNNFINVNFPDYITHIILWCALFPMVIVNLYFVTI